jgi:hypothetical protein
MPNLKSGQLLGKDGKTTDEIVKGFIADLDNAESVRREAG